MNVLILSYIQLEREGRFYRLYNSLKKHHNVCIIDTSNEYRKAEFRTTFNLKMKKPILKNIEFLFRALFEASKYEYDIVYSCNYFTSLIGVILSKLYNKPLVSDVYELYYPGGKDKFTIRDRIFYLFEKSAIKKSKYVLCASEERALIMTGHYNLKHVPVVVRNINSEGKFYGRQKSREQLNEKLKIVYVGFLAEDRFIIEFIEKIKDSKFNNKVEFDIYGKGPLLNELNKIIMDSKYSFVSIKGEYKNSELRGILKNYHVGYLAYPNIDFNNIFCAPNKLYDYVSYGLVVISPYNYTLQKIINNSKIGYCDRNILYSLKMVMENYHEYYNNLEEFFMKNLWIDEEKRLLKLFED